MIADLKTSLLHECIQACNAYSKKEPKRDYVNKIVSFENEGQRLDADGSVHYRTLEQDLPGLLRLDARRVLEAPGPAASRSGRGWIQSFRGEGSSAVAGSLCWGDRAGKEGVCVEILGLFATGAEFNWVVGIGGRVDANGFRGGKLEIETD